MLTAFMTPVARMHGRRCAIRTPAPWSCSLPAPGRPRPLWAAHLRAQGRRLWLRVQSAGGEEPMELQPGVNGNFRVDEEDDEDLGLDGEEGVPEESLDLDEEEIEQMLGEGYLGETSEEEEEEEEPVLGMPSRRAAARQMRAEMSELDSLIEGMQANMPELTDSETDEEGSRAGSPAEAMQRRLAAAGGASADMLGSMLAGGAPAEAAAAGAAAAASDGNGSAAAATAAAADAAATAAAGAQQAAAAAAAEAGDDEDYEFDYPPLPQRSYALAALLRAAGLEEGAEQAEALGVGDAAISDLVTCNSESAGPGALYVCVPSNDSDDDGHYYVSEAAEMGVSAVLACAPVPNHPAGVPIIYVEDTQVALSSLAAEFYERPSRRMRTVGLVGSYGKTTAAWLMRGMFEEAGEELVGMVGTIEYAIGSDRVTAEGEIWVDDERDTTRQRDCSTPWHVAPYEYKYGSPDTTPDALHLHKVLASIADRGGSTTLVECHTALMQDCRCEDLDLDVAVFTNLHPDATQQAAVAFAAEDEDGEIIFDELTPEEAAESHQAAVESVFERLTDPERHRGVVNVDDPFGRQLAAATSARGVTVLTYALADDQADVYAERVKTTIWETEVLVRTPLGRLQIILPLLGRTNVYNILAAVAVGLACGVPLQSIVAGIEAVDVIPGRSEILDEGQQFSVVVDSARTPAQLERLLDDVHETTKRTLLVLGCPGTTSKEQRQAMAAAAHSKSELVFFTNDSPGGDFPDHIIEDMVSGLPEEVRLRFSGTVYNNLQDMHRVPQWYQQWLMNYQSAMQRFVIEDRFSAIRIAIGMAKHGDVVVVAGRGHLDFMDFWDGQASKVVDEEGNVELDTSGTVRGWFDDRVECRNALGKLEYLEDTGLNRDALPWTRWKDEDRDVLEMHGLMAEEYTVGDDSGGLPPWWAEQREAEEEGELGELGEPGEEEEEEEEDSDDEEDMALLGDEDAAAWGAGKR